MDEDICELPCATVGNATTCEASHEFSVDDEIDYLVATLNYPLSKGVAADHDFIIELSDGSTGSDCVNGNTEIYTVRFCRNAPGAPTTWQAAIESDGGVSDFYQLTITGLRSEWLSFRR